MNIKKSLTALVLFSSFVCLALADGPEVAVKPLPSAQDAGKDQGKQKDQKTPDQKDKKTPDQKDKIKQDKDKKSPDIDLTKPLDINVFDQALMPRNETASASNPHMMGDFGVIYVRETITLFGTLTKTQTFTTFPTNPNGTSGGPIVRAPGLTPITRTVTTTTPFSETRTLLIPYAVAGAFKVADNASPRPQDRVFMTYNYFDDIQGPGAAPIPGINNTQSTTIAGPGGSTTTTSTTASVAGLSRLTSDLNREVFGFEKTFLDGNASIEMRAPVFQQSSSINGFGAEDVGDLTIIGKYAFINDRTTGNVLSGGLAVTAPTGPRIPLPDGNLHSTLLQPWLGYIWNADSFFVHAFHSVVVPTDPRDVTLLFNDIGVNYWLYRNNSNRILNFIVPMAEVHVTTPLDHRDANSAVYVPDIVVLTGGVHFGLFRNTTLSLGVATPVTGPRVYNVEGFVQLNWRF